MSRATVLARGRLAAENSMVDTCTIRRRTGEVFNRTTGVTTPTYVSPDPYTGKCRVQQGAVVQAQQHDVGEDYQLLQRLEVQLPMSVVGLEVGDEITIDSSTNDPDLVGRVFVVHDLAHKTDATARRVQCTERTGS